MTQKRAIDLFWSDLQLDFVCSMQFTRRRDPFPYTDLNMRWATGVPSGALKILHKTP